MISYNYSIPNSGTGFLLHIADINDPSSICISSSHQLSSFHIDHIESTLGVKFKTPHPSLPDVYIFSE